MWLRLEAGKDWENNVSMRFRVAYGVASVMLERHPYGRRLGLCLWRGRQPTKPSITFYRDPVLREATADVALGQWRLRVGRWPDPAA